MSSMKRKIYLALKTEDGKLESFTGMDGKQYAVLYFVFRTLQARKRNTPVLFVRINDKYEVFDGTAPQLVDELPKDAFRISHHKAEALHQAKTHMFGEEAPF